MKLAIAVIFLAASAAAMHMGQKHTCDSPMAYFTSLVGEEAMKHGKMLLKMKMKGSCVKMEISDKEIDILKTCGLETVTSMISMIGKRPTAEKKFGPEDLTEAYNKMVTCKLKKAANIDVNNGIDKQKYKNMIKETLTNCVKDPKMREIMMTMCNECTDMYLKNGKGNQAIKEMTKAESCSFDKLLEYCEGENKSPGIFIKLIRAFISLQDDPKCVAPIGPEVLKEPAEQCLVEANTEWNNDASLPKKFSLESTNENENIETSFNFFKNFLTQIVLKTCVCTGIKNGYFNKTENNIHLSKANILKFVLNLKWENNKERDAFVAIITKCTPEQDDPMIIEMNNMIEMIEPDSHMNKMLIVKKLLMGKMKFDQCACKDFVKTCGLNNDVAKIMIPILNHDLMNMFSKDFMDKGGVVAAMHMMGVLREKIDFSKLLNSV